MRLSKRRRKVDGGTIRSLAADGGNSDDFLGCGRSDGDFSPTAKFAAAADAYPGCAFACRSDDDLSDSHANTDMRDCDGFDSMPDAIDVNRILSPTDISETDVTWSSCSGMRVRSQICLGSCLPTAVTVAISYCSGICNDGIAVAKAKCNLLPTTKPDTPPQAR